MVCCFIYQYIVEWVKIGSHQNERHILEYFPGFRLPAPYECSGLSPLNTFYSVTYPGSSTICISPENVSLSARRAVSTGMKNVAIPASNANPIKIPAAVPTLFCLASYPTMKGDMSPPRRENEVFTPKAYERMVVGYASGV